ncbi:MAG: PAS domain-containing protein [Chitinivibrionales bacterium]
MNVTDVDARTYAQSIVDTLREPFIVLDENLRVISAGRSFYRRFAVTPQEAENRLIFELGNGQWNIPRLRQLLETIIPEHRTVEDYEMRHQFDNIGERVMLLNARRVIGEDHRPGMILLAIEDITEKVAIDPAQKFYQSEATLNAVLDALPVGINITDEKGRIIRSNAATRELWGEIPQTNSWEEYDRWVAWRADTGERIDAHQWALSRALRYGEVTRNELVRCKKFGSDEQRYFINNAVPLRDSQGLISGGVEVMLDVTHMRETQQQLTRRNALLEATINSIPDGYIVYDTKRTIICRNRLAEEVMGFTEQQWRLPYEQRIALLDVRSRDGEPLPVKKFPSARAFEGETVHNQIIRITRPQRHYWLSVSAAPIVAGEGTLYGVVMEFADITEWVEAQRGLRHALGLLRSVTQGTDDLIAAADREYRYTYFNKAFFRESEKLWHRKIRIGMNMLELMAAWPDQQHEAQKMWRRALSGESFNVTTAVGPPDGEQQYYDIRFNPLRDMRGEIIGAAHFLRNVTDEVRLRNALAESREQFIEVLESMPDAYVSFDKNLRFTYVNKKAERLQGVTRDELLGRSVREVYTDAESRRSIDRCEEILRTRESLIETSYYALFDRWIEIRAFATSAGVSVFYKDVSDQKCAEQEISHRTEELAAANRDLEAFSYSVSHDLRAPLQTIGSFTTLLVQGYEHCLDDEGRFYLQLINDGVTRASGIIDDLLRLAHIGRHEIVRENINISAIVNDYLRELKSSAPDRKTEFIVECNVHANADPRLLHLALENILRNAWKFTGRKDFTRIEFGTTTHDSQPVYYIRDNGAGFEMQFAQSIFFPFTRVHAEKEYRGTGVGLSIVQRVIARHGGKVWAEGEVDKGACFYFTLG